MLSANLADASGGSCFPKEATCLIRYLSLDILHVYIYMYVCMYVFMYVCMYVCVCVGGYLFASISLSLSPRPFISFYPSICGSFCFDLQAQAYPFFRL